MSSAAVRQIFNRRSRASLREKPSMIIGDISVWVHLTSIDLQLFLPFFKRILDGKHNNTQCGQLIGQWRFLNDDDQMHLARVVYGNRKATVV